jgi:hypothetical protein
MAYRSASVFYLLLLSLISIPLQAQGTCSVGNGEPAIITFENETSSTLSLYWVDYSCQETAYGTLSPESSIVQETYDQAEWVIRDESGNEVLRVLADNDVEPTFTIIGTSTHVETSGCSLGNDEFATIDFINRTNRDVFVYWVDYSCQEVAYEGVPAGMMIPYETYDHHEWVLRDADGTEIARLAADSDVEVSFVIGNAATGSTPYTPQENWEWEVITDASGCTPRPVTAADGLDPFYEIMCAYKGIPIASSSNVPAEALQQAWLIVANMLQGHPQLIETLAANQLIVGIVAESEGITVLPEYAFLRDDPQTNWDERSRGLGGSIQVPLTSGAEENLLCYQSDPYLGENIFLHEFAHTMKDMGIAVIDPAFNLLLGQIYEQAIADGLWEDTYAATNPEEYWAEGVQSYFNVNLEAIPTNGIHNDINTRDELAAYDPFLYALIDSIFAGFEWTPACQ